MLQNDLHKLLFSPTPLHPELERYHHVTDLGHVIHHPWVIEIGFRPDFSGHVNARYEHKKKEIPRLVAAKQWQTVIFMHERPYRFQALWRYRKQMDPKIYWELFGDCWIDSENVFENKTLLRKMFKFETEFKKHFAEKRNWNFLKALPQHVIVFRGCTKQNRYGLSWTLNQEKAVWFSKRFRHNGFTPLVIQGRISKDKIFAFTNDRHENEVIAEYKDVANVKTLVI